MKTKLMITLFLLTSGQLAQADYLCMGKNDPNSLVMKIDEDKPTRVGDTDVTVFYNDKLVANFVGTKEVTDDHELFTRTFIADAFEPDNYVVVTGASALCGRIACDELPPQLKYSALLKLGKKESHFKCNKVTFEKAKN